MYFLLFIFISESVSLKNTKYDIPIFSVIGISRNVYMQMMRGAILFAWRCADYSLSMIEDESRLTDPDIESTRLQTDTLGSPRSTRSQCPTKPFPRTTSAFPHAPTQVPAATLIDRFTHQSRVASVRDDSDAITVPHEITELLFRIYLHPKVPLAERDKRKLIDTNRLDYTAK